MSDNDIFRILFSIVFSITIIGAVALVFFLLDRREKKRLAVQIVTPGVSDKPPKPATNCSWLCRCEKCGVVFICSGRRVWPIRHPDRSVVHFSTPCPTPGCVENPKAQPNRFRLEGGDAL